MEELILKEQNNIKEICQGYWKTYKVIFNNEKYSVKVENDDFNNFEVEIFSNDIKLDSLDDEYQDIINYLENEKII